ncbi:MAG: EF-P lysine aminoacylase GenX [Lentisphaerae bacterium]|nr:EF-P lysine aminoacylase GenX [Lentisphaerota bacterium]
MPALRLRSDVLSVVRDFFVRRGFTEIETPVLVPVPALERHIDAQPAGDGYLRTSPELHMKRLLAAGFDKIFQVGSCFRKGEHGPRHRPEYTMLEWYRVDADYMDILSDAKDLLVDTARRILGGTALRFNGQDVELAGEWDCLSVRVAFQRWAGWDPLAEVDPDRFDVDLVDRVEPRLPGSRPFVLKDYPPHAAALALCTGDPPVARRWELYLAGVELANAFTELTDPVEQRRRFECWAAERSREGRPVYPLDEGFLAALEQGMPEAGGAALGIDRLVMLLADMPDIADVQAFPD